MGDIAPPADAVDLDLSAHDRPGPAHDTVNIDLGAGEEGRPLFSQVPGLILNAGLPWRPQPDATALRLIARHGTASHIDRAQQIGYEKAGHIDRDTTLRHERTEQRDRHAAHPWSTPTPQDRSARARHDSTETRDIDGRSARWQETSVRMSTDTRAPFLVVTPEKDREQKSPWFEVHKFTPLWRRERNLPESLDIPPALDYDLNLDERDKSIAHDKVDFSLGGVIAAHPSQPKDRNLLAQHNQAAEKTIHKTLPWGPAGQRDTTLEFEYPDYTGPITDPGDVVIAIERETYTYMNIVNVKRVSDDAPLDVQDISIQNDVDSWAWTFTGTVIGVAGLAMVEPGPSGLVDIEVTLNGHVWIFMIESYSGVRKHPGQRFTIRGVSRTQALAAPYSEPVSRSYPTDIQASQVIDDELAFTGFEAVWETTPSWIIEGGAFSIQDLTPMALARRIAEAAGAIIVPDKADDKITIKPRFRIPPWNLAAAELGEMDAQIPLAAVAEIGMTYQPATLYDSVYVSGTTHGYAILAERDGTGGLSPAPDVFDDLMTDTDVNIERARQELSASGPYGMYTLTLAVPESEEAPGLLEPGMVVEAIEGDPYWRGYVLGTTITAPRTGAAKMEQKVEIVRFFGYE